MMLIIVFVVLSIIITSVFGRHTPERDPLKEIPLLSDTYKDIFVGSQGGKPQLGTMSATCWARGGVCVHIRHCPDNKSFDTGVSGCTTHFKVCCKLFQQLPPTVGIQRSRNDEEDVLDINKDIVKPVDLQVLIPL